MTETEKRIKKFADKKFGARSPADRFRKLGEEFGELGEAIAVRGLDGIKEEAADMGLVLSDMLAIIDCSLQECMEEKLEIVEAREYGRHKPKKHKL